jgi:5-methyltetrahydrofolate--homocysteine methyltransferase
MSNTSDAAKNKAARTPRPFGLIGELMNHSFARARRAWAKRDTAAYQKLAQLQDQLGADALTVNLDGTQQLRVRPEEMIDFIPDIVPALQEATALPLAFDNPWIEFHRKCLEIYDSERSGPAIFNSVAASRLDLDAMYELIREYDTRVVVMASEKFVEGGGSQCFLPEEVHRTAREFVELLTEKAGRTNDQIIIDPGLAPISADIYGLVNMGLDAMKLIRADPDLKGVHLSVGLTNFSFGVPQEIREGLENAYITLALEAGLDFVLGSPEKDLHPLKPDDRHLEVVTQALAEGRPKEGETQEDAGFRQAIRIMDLYQRKRRKKRPSS